MFAGTARSSGSTRSASHAPRLTTRPNDTFGSGDPAACSPTCGSRWRSPKARAIPRRCSKVRAASSRRPSVIGRRNRRSSRGGPPRALHVARHLRRASRELAGSASCSAGVIACSSTRTSTSTAGRRPERRGVLREEHDADHRATAVGGARGARHRRGSRADAASRHGLRRLPHLHRRLSDRCARRAGDARLDPVPVVLDTGAGGDSRGVSRRSSARRCTAATSARTSVPWNRGVAKRRAPIPRTGGSRRPRHWLEQDAAGRASTTVFSSRATSRAGCGATRSSHSATPARTSTEPLLERIRADETSCVAGEARARRRRAVG